VTQRVARVCQWHLSYLYSRPSSFVRATWSMRSSRCKHSSSIGFERQHGLTFAVPRRHCRLLAWWWWCQQLRGRQPTTMMPHGTAATVHLERGVDCRQQVESKSGSACCGPASATTWQSWHRKHHAARWCPYGWPPAWSGMVSTDSGAGWRARSAGALASCVWGTWEVLNQQTFHRIYAQLLDL